MPLRFGLSQGVKDTATPCIPQARAWGAGYKSTPDAPLLDLSQGVPGDAPHPLLLEGLAKASATHEAARYGPILGEPSLRAALATELARLYDADIKSEDIAITAGCNMAFLVLLMTLCTPFQSSVLIPLPSYFNHTMCLSMQNVQPAYIPCDPEDFTPSLEAARKILEDDRSQKDSTSGTPKVRPGAILLTTPNNPTGALYPSSQLESWLALAREFNIPLILDETYRDFAPPHTLFNDPQWRDTLISVGSFSKSYRIPGHRVGNITASPELLEHVTTTLDCMQICAPRPAQIALAPLLPALRDDLVSASDAMNARLKMFGEVISSVPGWRVASSGGFFAYVKYPDEYNTHPERLGVGKVGSSDVGKALAMQCGVLTLPGYFFMPDTTKSVPWSNLEGDAVHEDRWIRFAVANVSDEVVRSLAPRLRKMNEIMGM